MIRRNFNH